MTIAELIAESHGTAVSKGWWSRPEDDNVPTKIALSHSELSEALEEFRQGYPLDKINYAPNGKPVGFAIEIADAVIRMADFCGRWNIPLEEALRAKLAYNRTREPRHGGKAV